MSRVREHRLVRRSGMLGVFGLLLIPALIAIAPSVATASCATAFPSDAGCLFAEKWGSYSLGTLPTSPWYWNGGTSTGLGDSVTTPGVNSDTNKMTFTMHPPNGTGYDCPGCPGGDGPGSGVLTNGTTYWLEFFVSYSADYQWGCGGGVSGTTGGNCAQKTIDPLAVNQRILLEVWGRDNDSPPYSKGHLTWSFYPNYAPGGTDADGVNRLTQRAANVTDVVFQPGHFYRVILQVLVGQNTSGAYKCWVCPDGTNCTLTHDISGLQTSSESTWSGNGTGIGGPAAGPTKNSTWSVGSIRYTTTNISGATPLAAPTSGTPPAAPTSLVVQ